MKHSKKKSSRSFNFSGSKFGRLIVVKQLDSEDYQRMWLCQCDCGNTHKVPTALLTSGGVRSCGCLQREHWRDDSKTHGLSQTHIFYSFFGAKARCENKNNPKYKNYGARGIKMEWGSFEDFLRDMLPAYEEHCKEFGKKNTTLERKNVDGNYSKENCRWATWIEQARNKQKAITMNVTGKEVRITDLARLSGISYHSLYQGRGRAKLREWIKIPENAEKIKDALGT